MSCVSLRVRALVACACGLLLASTAWAQSSTFSDTIGNAVLCRDVLDPAYFFRYLSTEYGVPYQHQGGAWWFKTPKTRLWDVPVTAVAVSDDQGSLLFVMVMTDLAPDKLAQAIMADAGVRFDKGSVSVHPVLVSSTGSMIAWADTQSKIYCAQSRKLFRLP